MKTLTEELRQDLIDRYDISFEGVEDTLGIIQLAKDNFKRLLDKLIEICQNN